jgi:hypothetical protein
MIPHLIDKETKAQGISDVPNVTELVNTPFLQAHSWCRFHGPLGRSMDGLLGSIKLLKSYQTG